MEQPDGVRPQTRFQLGYRGFGGGQFQLIGGFDQRADPIGLDAVGEILRHGVYYLVAARVRQHPGIDGLSARR